MSQLRKYPQLSRKEEVFYDKLVDSTKELRAIDRSSLKLAKELIDSKPIQLSSEGIMFMRNTVRTTEDEHTSKKSKKSLIIPIETSYFRVINDYKKEYSDNCDTLLFEDRRDPTHVFGIIYPDTEMMYLHVMIRSPYDLTAMMKLLGDNIQHIIQLIGDDPKMYFSTVGLENGFCMFCGRDLSDETSKKNGYGPVCGKYINQYNVLRKSLHQQPHAQTVSTSTSIQLSETKTPDTSESKCEKVPCCMDDKSTEKPVKYCQSN